VVRENLKYGSCEFSLAVQVIQVTQLRGETTRMTCPHCKAEISTRVKYQPGRMTHIVALILCCFM
jgi:hypothetical protein